MIEVELTMDEWISVVPRLKEAARRKNVCSPPLRSIGAARPVRRRGQIPSVLNINSRALRLRHPNARLEPKPSLPGSDCLT
jgi:hypothetical protein